MQIMLLGLHIVAFEFCFLQLKFPWKSSANNYFAMLLITIPLQVLPVPQQPPFTEYHVEEEKETIQQKQKGESSKIRSKMQLKIIKP